jgi:hypothetical protein
MGTSPTLAQTQVMRARDTQPGAWQGWRGWLQQRDAGGGPALLYVTCVATTVVVFAITLLALTGQPWMVAVAFIAVVFAVFAVTGFIWLMLTDRDGSR